MTRRFFKQVIWFALLYFIVAFVFSGIITLLSHLPPQAVNLDGLILGLAGVERVLMAPRQFLRALWPGETTPGVLRFAIAILNCLVWGVALAGVKALWTAIRK